MNKHIQHIIQQGENEQVEFKSSFSDEVIISLVAFANTKGGKVYVGIEDTGAIKGVQIGKETIQKWMNVIKSKTQPSIIPTIEAHSMNKKMIISIHVQEFPVKPLALKR
jgi:ATP-dependent DNA helicase RecG